MPIDVARPNIVYISEPTNACIYVLVCGLNKNQNLDDIEFFDLP